MGKKGENGPPVFFLYGGPTINGKFNGVLAEGNITADDLIGPMKGKSLSDLKMKMENGMTFARVHTTQNKAGEIRGQIH